jgi:hypothetical protein
MSRADCAVDIVFWENPIHLIRQFSRRKRRFLQSSARCWMQEAEYISSFFLVCRIVVSIVFDPLPSHSSQPSLPHFSIQETTIDEVKVSSGCKGLLFRSRKASKLRYSKLQIANAGNIVLSCKVNSLFQLACSSCLPERLYIFSRSFVPYTLKNPIAFIQIVIGISAYYRLFFEVNFAQCVKID